MVMKILFRQAPTASKINLMYNANKCRASRYLDRQVKTTIIYLQNQINAIFFLDKNHPIAYQYTMFVRIRFSCRNAILSSQAEHHTWIWHHQATQMYFLYRILDCQHQHSQYPVFFSSQQPEIKNGNVAVSLRYDNRLNAQCIEPEFKVRVNPNVKVQRKKGKNLSVKGVWLHC